MTCNHDASRRDASLFARLVPVGIQAAYDDANAMHEAVVAEISARMISGTVDKEPQP